MNQHTPIEQSGAHKLDKEEEFINQVVEKTPSQPAAPRGWSPPPKALLTNILLAVIVAAGALVILYVWELPPFRTAVQTTDNAYVRGQTTVIAPQVNGYVVEVLVHDFEQIREGQPIVRIDDRIYRQRVEQAQASLGSQLAALESSHQSERASEVAVRVQQAALAEASAQRDLAKINKQRTDSLVAGKTVSEREHDEANSALVQAEAKVEQAQAQLGVAHEQVRTIVVARKNIEAQIEGARAALALAEIDLSNTVVRAPTDGEFAEVGVRLGQYVTAGSQLTFLVPAQRWIIANFKEGQTAHIYPGQPAVVSVDALEGLEFHGHVERMSPAAGSEFTVIRPDNATGNFVKIAQRIPVRIALDPDVPEIERLRPGMSVIAHVDTGTLTRATNP